jgi:hypothetical protein
MLREQTMRSDARRLFITLRGWDLDRQTIGILAEIAALMRADLEAVLLQEDAFPLAREFQPATNEWKLIDPERLRAEIVAIGRRAERLVEEAARTTGIVGRFAIAKGSPAALLAERVGRHDIIAIAEPGVPHVGSIISEPDMIPYGAAATLLLPRRTVRRKGAVAALVLGPSDPALALAAEIAFVSGSALILLIAADGERRRHIVEHALAGGLPRARLKIMELSRLDTQAVLAALEHAGERVIVLSRGIGESADVIPADIKSMRRVPLLLVEPENVQP